jgi:ribosome maturation factor RimP
MTASLAEGVRALAEPAVGRAGLVLDALSITTAGRRRVLRLIVDLPDDASGGVSMDAVAEASQHVSAALDGSDLLGSAPYVLEVSSPGTDRPLTERRHWLRARTRLVEVKLTDGGSRTGRLTAVDDAGITLDGPQPQPSLAWQQIASGRVQVEFGSPVAAAE